MPWAVKLASASASGTNVLGLGSIRVAAGTLHAAGDAAGPAIADRLQALVELRAERLTITVPRSDWCAASMSCLSTNIPLLERAGNVAGG